MTAAKMVLHDWQRGRIPFFVPPPRQEDETTEGLNAMIKEKDSLVDTDKEAAAMRAIENVVSSQQLRNVPVQRDLFTDNELNGCDNNDSDPLPPTDS